MRAAASTLMLSCFVSEPGAIATGSMTQHESQHRTTWVARFAGLGSLGDVIPGFRSLRSLHPGLNSVAAPRLVDSSLPLPLLTSL